MSGIWVLLCYILTIPQYFISLKGALMHPVSTWKVHRCVFIKLVISLLSGYVWETTGGQCLWRCNSETFQACPVFIRWLWPGLSQSSEVCLGPIHSTAFSIQNDIGSRRSKYTFNWRPHLFKSHNMWLLVFNISIEKSWRHPHSQWSDE